MSRAGLGMGLGLGVIFAEPSLALAQGTLASQETTIPGGTLVMVAYLVLWVLLGGYAFLIARRQAKLQREIKGLDARIDEAFGGEERGA